MADANDLTPEEWAFVDKFVDEHSRVTIQDISPESLRPAVNALYKALDAAPPEHIVCFDSREALFAWQREQWAKEQPAGKAGDKEWDRAKSQHMGTDGIGLPQRRWLAHFRCVIDELTKLEPDDNSRLAGEIYPLSMCVYDSVVYDTHFACVKNPRVDVDDNWELHSATRAAFHWAEDEEKYYWHGVEVPKALIMDPMSLVPTAMQLTTEVRRALCEKLGWDVALSAMGATEVSSQVDKETGLAYTLYRFPSGEQALKKQSPVLLTGSQPFYVEQVADDLKTALGARKWQVPWERLGLPSVSAAECDRNPALQYVWEK
jgi:hypothetical protein